MAENSLLVGLRTTHNYTASEIAIKSGMDEDHYQKLESGELKMKIDDAGKLSAIYKIEPEIFLQSPTHITNNNIGEHSKGIIYATHYFDSLSVEDIDKLKKKGIL
ncbi:MAG TPA: helix-turn-helix transcriptional regulator [Hanamia sp.]|nr:helix-turn-helix transcriptional regulator [Hanamia sp.]